MNGRLLVNTEAKEFSPGDEIAHILSHKDVVKEFTIPLSAGDTVTLVEREGHDIVRVNHDRWGELWLHESVIQWEGAK